MHGIYCEFNNAESERKVDHKMSVYILLKFCIVFELK